MSEISKIYKKYGESTGHTYLTIFNCFLMASASIEKDNGGKSSDISANTNRYLLNEYGNGFLIAYNEFARENRDNEKLKSELEKRRGEFANKSIYDAIRDFKPKTKSDNSAAAQGHELNKEQRERTEYSSILSSQNNENRLDNYEEGSVSGHKDNQIIISSLKSALFRDPYDVKGWNLLGDAYKEAGEQNNAEACYKKAVSLNSKPIIKRPVTIEKPADKPKQEPIVRNENKPNAASSVANDSEEEGYYFENMLEFALYAKLFGGKKKFTWLSGDAYIVEFQKGYQLIEQMKYQSAIVALKNALKLNPVGVSARMEMCTAYCRLKNTMEARRVLERTRPYLYSDALIAKYYRLLGYILVEELEYRTAAYCYQYSTYFENHPTVAGELEFIKGKIGQRIVMELRNRTEVERFLRNTGINVITKSVLEADEEPEEKIETKPIKSIGSILDCKGKIVEKSTFKGQQAVTVSIELKNTGDEPFPGNVELYYPDKSRVEDFTPSTIDAGSSKIWKGIWILTKEEESAGTFSFFVRYPVIDKDGSGKSIKAKRLNFSL